jgi:hypothetical protein
MNQSSVEWLKTHDAEFLKLTLKDLMDKGKISKYFYLKKIYLLQFKI